MPLIPSRVVEEVEEEGRHPTVSIYLGIDPGASGGLAAIRGVTPASSDTHASQLNGMTLEDAWGWLAEYGSDRATYPAFAVIEKVGGFVAGNPLTGSSMFKFGESYGALKALLTAAGIPYEEVTPQKWQKLLGIAPRKKGKKEKKTWKLKAGKNKGKTVTRVVEVGGESDSQFKARLRAKAQQLFPGQSHVTLATADALLIAEYCRRSREGKL